MPNTSQTTSYSYIENNGKTTESNININNNNGKISGSSKIYKNGKLISDKSIENFQVSYNEYDYNLINKKIEQYYLNEPILAKMK